jgi:hypothetical protein
MPVDFICPQCQQLLAVPRRKVGTTIDCPRCGEPALVEPALVEAGQASVVARGKAGPMAGAFDEIVLMPSSPPLTVAPPPSALPRTALPKTARPPQSWTDPVEPRESRPQRLTGRVESYDDMLLISRRIVYMQAVLFCVVAGVAFAAGWLLARRGIDAASSAPQVVDGPVSVGGVVTFGPRGAKRKDAGAIVIALPADAQLDEKLPAKGLRPTDDSETLANLAAERVRDLGGDCVRADAEGAFQLVVSRPGRYHLLIISSHTRREKREPIDDGDLRSMSKWFDVVSEVIGLHRYRWSSVELGAKTEPLVQTFADG